VNTFVELDQAILESDSIKFCIPKDWQSVDHFASIYHFSKSMVLKTAKEHGIGQTGMREGDKKNSYWIPLHSVEDLWRLCTDRLSGLEKEYRRQNKLHFFDINAHIVSEQAEKFADQAYDVIQPLETAAEKTVADAVNTVSTEISANVTAPVISGRRRGRLKKELSDQLDGMLMINHITGYSREMSVAEIANKCNVSKRTVVQHKKKLEIYLQGYIRGFEQGRAGF
jgi:hypothetical protein